MIPWKVLGFLIAIGVGLVGGAFGAHYVDLAQEAKRVENCAEGIKAENLTSCPKRIVDAFATLSLKSAEVSIEYRDRYITQTGTSYAEDLARLEGLKSDLSELASQPVTNQCAAAPAMVTLREQICREVGGCEP